MNAVRTVFRREFAGYFATPLAAVYLVIFLVLAGIFTFNLGGLYESRQASLRPFFTFLPWLLLFLVPAISMRIWAEERRLGTIELLMTLPVSIGELVVGKFLAAWAFCAVAVGLTFPLWVTVAWLGDPDHGVILTSYLGGLLMAGAFLAVGAALSALTKNQVIAFVLCLIVFFALMLSGYPAFTEFVPDWMPDFVADSLAYLSFLSRYAGMQKGVVDLRDVFYFASVIVAALAVNGVVLRWKKAD